MYQLAKSINPKTSAQLISNIDPDARFFRKLEAQGIHLNEKQIEAVRTMGASVVLAGAGSGKSTCIIAKVAYLVFKGIPPDSILVITYTKKAANELKHRLKALNVTTAASTIHALCYKILRQNGYERYKLLTNDKHKESILKKILHDMQLLDHYQPESLLSQISCLKNSLVPYEELNNQAREILQRFDQYKEEHKLLDFDDMLVETLKLLRINAPLLHFLQRQFQYVFIDEFQDICPLQYEIVKLISMGNLCVVGDPRQTIYSFRGSDINIILDFAKVYKAKKTELNINYRSTPQITGFASEIIKHCNLSSNSYVTKESGKPPVFLRPGNLEEEAGHITRQILNHIKHTKRQYKDFAILFRTSTISRAIFEELTMNNIPFIAYGMKDTLYEQDVIRPVISHLRLSMEPNDQDALRNILLSLYLNRLTTFQYINTIFPAKSMVDLLTSIPGLPDYHHESICNRVRLIKTMKHMSPLEAIRRLRNEGGYDKYLKITDALALKAEMIKDLLQDLEEVAAQYETVEQFLSFVDSVINKSKEMQAMEQGSNVNAVSLMSIHSSKGLQFPVVFIIGAIEGIIPHKYVTDPGIKSESILVNEPTSDIDEECRLLYVAATRAEEELYISIPQQYHNKPTDKSRFLP